MKKVVYFLIFICVFARLCWGCGSKDEIISGKMSDVILTVSDTDFDFGANVSFTDKNGAVVDFTYDSSSVKFGKAGQYTVIYKVGETQYERIVYIYGEPIIQVVNPDVAYK
ncbi:MAG: hypothetical protein J6Y43_01565, partial [Clostridia bacterium]|nr:hypothetical protein [Clostridia bacterium]